jgi:hypothetical protein
VESASDESVGEGHLLGPRLLLDFFHIFFEPGLSVLLAIMLSPVFAMQSYQ